MSTSPEPVSRRDRPAKPALSRRWIIDTAVRIMRSEGLEKVTMRRLAKELDTGPASLYVYVANTAELHAAVLDAQLGQVDLAAETAGPEPRDQLVAVLTSYTLVLFEHPQLARSALVARPNGPNYLALLERVLQLLARSGAPRQQVAWGVDNLLQYATATAAEHATQEQDPNAERDWHALSRAVHEVDESTHPAIKAHLPELLTGAEDRLTWGFHVLINGITHTPLP
ncbi:TetR/AcrR family transcriptional regulator [Amycolatopsis thermalba]|uniref:TetR/AcrR family transcriptional regulator n=1 Tax=Amycolatopsis thermalba TaxID=944492 RepID=UPI000E229A62|nr:TetR/AcrR family transcriptional regulator [Amycolatopsis thermalba]